MSFLGGIVGGAVNGISHLAGNVVNTVKKAGTDIGHGVGAVASNPLVQMLTAAGLAATGVGAPAAAALMAAERGGGALLKNGGNIGDGLKGAATGAAMGYGASKAGDLLYHGLGGVGSGSGLVSSGGGVLSGLSDRAKSIAMSSLTGGASGSGSGGSVAGGGGGATAGGGGSSILDKLLLGGTVAAGAMDAADQKALRDKAADAATGSYDERAPLRARALALLNNPVTPNKSAIFANPGNPYDRQRRAAMLAQSAVPSSSSASPSVLPS